MKRKRICEICTYGIRNSRASNEFFWDGDEKYQRCKVWWNISSVERATFDGIWLCSGCIASMLVANILTKENPHSLWAKQKSIRCFDCRKKFPFKPQFFESQYYPDRETTANLTVKANGRWFFHDPVEQTIYNQYGEDHILMDFFLRFPDQIQATNSMLLNRTQIQDLVSIVMAYLLLPRGHSWCGECFSRYRPVSSFVQV